MRPLTRRGLPSLLLTLTLIATIAPIAQAKSNRIPTTAAQELAEIRINRFNQFAKDLAWNKLEDIDILRSTITQIDRLIQADADFSYAYLLRGHLKSALSESTPALADLNKAVSLLPKQSAAYHLRGLAHAKQGNTTAAIADFTQAIQLYDIVPKEESARLHYIVQHSLESIYQDRSKAYAKAKNFGAAIADLTRIIDQGNDDLLEERADLYIQQGNRKAAIVELTQVIDLDETAQSAYLKRAKLYRESGDFKAASADYATAIALMEADVKSVLHPKGIVGSIVRSQQAYFLENDNRFATKLEDLGMKDLVTVDPMYRYTLSLNPTATMTMVTAQPTVINRTPAIGLTALYKVNNDMSTYALLCMAEKVNTPLPTWSDIKISNANPKQPILCPSGYVACAISPDLYSASTHQTTFCPSGYVPVK